MQKKTEKTYDAGKIIEIAVPVLSFIISTALFGFVFWKACSFTSCPLPPEYLAKVFKNYVRENPPKTKEDAKLVKNEEETKTNQTKSYANDEKFSLKFRPWRYGWDKRYGVTKDELVFEDWQLKWAGKKKITKENLEKLVKKTLRGLPQIKTSDELVALLVETIITESDGGRIVESKTHDFGIIQMKISTSKSLHSWLKDNHKDVYAAIFKFRNEKLSEKDNIIQNLPYAVAMMATEYWRKSGQNFGNYLDSLHNRAVLWKSVYNTRYGLGTVNAYIKRNIKYRVPQKKEVASR